MSLEKQRTILVCSCERTMPAFGDHVARACGNARVVQGDQLCGAEIERVRAILVDGGPVTIACTQQAPLFTEVAEELGFAGELAFANIRETGGWSDQAGAAAPAAAALLAVAAEPAAQFATVSLQSSGVVLIYGRDDAALEAARALAD
jgi:heterodisulfide reductase subunit A-like polyferredoxin